MRRLDALKWSVLEQRDYTTRYLQYEKILPLKVSTNNSSIFPLITQIAAPAQSYKNPYYFYIHDVKPQSKVFSCNWPDGREFRRGLRDKIFQSGSRGYLARNGRRDMFICYDRLIPEAFLSHLRCVFSQLAHGTLQKALTQVHASTLAVGGRGILLIGHAGVGKTTLTLKCSKDGLDFVSDDHSFLKREGDLIWVLGLDGMVKLRKDGFKLLQIQKFPYIYETAAPRSMYVFDIEKVFPGKRVRKAPAAILCFLCQEMSGKPVVKISAQEALNMLLSQGLFYSPSDPVKALDLAIDLVNQTRHYKLNPLNVKIAELCRLLNLEIC